MILDLLAVARLARFWTEDAIDFPPTRSIRKTAERKLQGTSWEPLLDCPWCVSFWLALGLLTAKRAAPSVISVVTYALAGSEAAGLLHTVEELANEFVAQAKRSELRTVLGG